MINQTKYVILKDANGKLVPIETSEIENYFTNNTISVLGMSYPSLLILKKCMNSMTISGKFNFSEAEILNFFSRCKTMGV